MVAPIILALHVHEAADKISVAMKNCNRVLTSSLHYMYSEAKKCR